MQISTSNSPNSSVSSFFADGLQELHPIPREAEYGDSCRESETLIEVNLAKKPLPSTCQTNPPLEVTVGDIHANPLLVIQIFLIKGLFEMEDQDYDTFYKVQSRDSLNRFLNIHEIMTLRGCIERIYVRDEAISTRIIFLGDELADRGPNDYLILHILKKLHYSGIDYTITLSNHAIEHIRQAEYYYRAPGVNGNLCCRALCDHPQMFYGSAAHSLIALLDLMVDNNLIRDEVVSLYETVYKKHLQILTYRIMNKTDYSQITLMFHGCIGLYTIERVVEQVNALFQKKIIYDDSNIFALAHTIDKLNASFEEIQTIPAWCDRILFDLSESSLAKMLWERNGIKSAQSAYDALYDPAKAFFASRSYTIKIIHGHSEEGRRVIGLEEHTFNLDSLLGKHRFITEELKSIGFLRTVDVVEDS